MNCYNDWAEEFIDRAVDQISGRLHEPMILTEENAWRKSYRYNWNNSGGGYDVIYYWYNSITEQRIDITHQEYQTQSQPTL